MKKLTEKHLSKLPENWIAHIKGAPITVHYDGPKDEGYGLPEFECFVAQADEYGLTIKLLNNETAMYWWVPKDDGSYNVLCFNLPEQDNSEEAVMYYVIKQILESGYVSTAECERVGRAFGGEYSSYSRQVACRF